MYEIYYNDKIIRLLHSNMQSFYRKTSDKVLNVHYPGKNKHIHSYLDKIEKSRVLEEINVYATDLKGLKEAFFGVFKIVEAAGGLVLNEKGEMLLIFRRGSWDLPKGKIDPDETKKEAAVREVIEETGVQDVVRLNKLVTTYHIYKTKHSAKRMLKPTYWYLMASHTTGVTPQEEEDIELVEWVSLKDLSRKKPMYSNISQVLSRFISRLEE